MQTDMEFIIEERFDVGESPVWDAATGTLYWCDIPAGVIHALHLETRARRLWTLGEAVTSFGLARNGRLVVALAQDVILFDPETGARQQVAHIAQPKPGMRLNDGKVGPDGAFWVGSMDSEPTPARGALFRVDAIGQVREITGGLATSNGLAWTANGRTMFHSDSRGDMFVDRWDFDPATGGASNRRRLREHDEINGRADGGAFDLDDTYWSSGPSCSRLNLIDLDGAIFDTIDLPLLRPTMPCFGGPDMRTVFVTSLNSGLDEAGRDGIVALRAPVAGVPVSVFAG